MPRPGHGAGPAAGHHPRGQHHPAGGSGEGLEQYDWTALIRRKVPAKFLEANLKAYQVGLQSV